MAKQKILAWDKPNQKQYPLTIDYASGDYLDYDINGVPFVKNWKAPTTQNNDDKEWDKWYQEQGVSVPSSPTSLGGNL